MSTFVKCSLSNSKTQTGLQNKIRAMIVLHMVARVAFICCCTSFGIRLQVKKINLRMMIVWGYFKHNLRQPRSFFKADNSVEYVFTNTINCKHREWVRLDSATQVICV